MTPSEYESLTGLKAYTKEQEYKRTAQLFKEILQKPNGSYFAIAFLYDSGYQNKDLKEIMKYLEPKK